MISMFIVFGLLYWTGMERMVRGQILTIKQNEYVLAAKISGAKSGRIIRRHILPNCVSVIIVAGALQIPSAIFTESFLSFIGLGVQAPMPSLGSLANAGRAGLTAYPYKLIFPAIMICLITLAFNLLGDGLRDAFFDASVLFQNLHNGICGNTFSGTGLSYDSQDLASVQIKGNTVYRHNLSSVSAKRGI